MVSDTIPTLENLAAAGVLLPADALLVNFFVEMLAAAAAALLPAGILVTADAPVERLVTLPVAAAEMLAIAPVDLLVTVPAVASEAFESAAID